MFHIRSGQIAATLMLLSVSAQPMISHASEPIEPAVITASNPSLKALDNAVLSAKDFSLNTFRRDAKTKLSETQQWVKEKTPQNNLKASFRELDHKIDRLQANARPAGRSIRSAVKGKIPAKGLIQTGDRKFSVFGLMLMMAFGIVLFLMSAANPISRLGGRH